MFLYEKHVIRLDYHFLQKIQSPLNSDTFNLVIFGMQHYNMPD